MFIPMFHLSCHTRPLSASVLCPSCPSRLADWLHSSFLLPAVLLLLFICWSLLLLFSLWRFITNLYPISPILCLSSQYIFHFAVQLTGFHTFNPFYSICCRVFSFIVFAYFSFLLCLLTLIFLPCYGQAVIPLPSPLFCSVSLKSLFCSCVPSPYSPPRFAPSFTLCLRRCLRCELVSPPTEAITGQLAGSQRGSNILTLGGLINLRITVVEQEKEE